MEIRLLKITKNSIIGLKENISGISFNLIYKCVTRIEHNSPEKQII